MTPPPSWFEKLDNVSYRRLGLPRCAFSVPKSCFPLCFCERYPLDLTVQLVSFAFRGVIRKCKLSVAHFQQKISSCCSLVTFLVHILSNFVHFLTYFVHFSPKLRNYSVESPQPSIIMWPPMARMLCRSGFDRSTPPSCLTQHTSNFRHRHQSIPCPGLRSTSIVSEPFRPPASACRSFVKHCSNNTPRLCAFTPDWPLIRTRPFIADSCPI